MLDPAGDVSRFNRAQGAGPPNSYERYGHAEARAYLADHLLRQRLEDVIGVIHDQRQQPGQRLERLMGGEPLILDALLGRLAAEANRTANVVMAQRLMQQISS